MVQPQRQDLAVAREIAVSGEDFPTAQVGNRANEKVDGRPGDASGATQVVDACRFLVILDPELGFVKGPQSVTHLTKAFFRPNS